MACELAGEISNFDNDESKEKQKRDNEPTPKRTAEKKEREVEEKEKEGKVEVKEIKKVRCMESLTRIKGKQDKRIRKQGIRIFKKLRVDAD